MKQYFTVKNLAEVTKNNQILKKFKLDGTEIFGDDILNRTENLEINEKLTKIALSLNVKRFHCSYWAYPTSFLNKINFNELIKRFSSVEEIEKYYGDLSGKHMFNRWIQEYKFADSINAKSYVFHLIDYAPIDGMWEFTITRQQILNSMLYMIQQFIILLIEEKAISKTSPIIELENAGWGLEYGAQTAEDFSYILNNLYDPYNKVRISWDINHLLHALGKKNTVTTFLLPESDKNKYMNEISNSDNLIEKWISHNLLYPEIISKTSCIHLSDCKLKEIEYFVKGKFIEPYHTAINDLNDWTLQEDYGVKIVLDVYDSHVPLEEGCLSGKFMKQIVCKLNENNEDFCILHELKNSTDLENDLDNQIKKLWN